ncbi:MAG: hypothetical protein KAH57_01010 [Thermoplasmata archaeon]|nr:hypothetical protein [Thermoplasmata archaeon]
MTKIEWTATKGWMLAIITIALFISAAIGLVIVIDILSDEPVGSILVVEEVYFVSEETTSGSMDLYIHVFVTNDGDEHCQSEIRAFAVDVETNLAMDETGHTVGTIDEQTTSESMLLMTLPSDGRYRVELLIFKDGKITVKGTGTVNLYLAGSGGKDYRTDQEDPAAGASKESAADVPFPHIGAVAIAVIAVALVVKRRWRR